VLFHLGNDDCQARYTKTDHKLHTGKELLGAIISIGNDDF
jgi:hypothetical protein